MQQTFDVDDTGELVIGGLRATDLAAQYQTPLYVYDVSKIRQAMRDFKQIFIEKDVDAVVSYASKAFATTAIYEIAKSEGIHLDVVSGGEIVTAQNAGFPLANVSFNGNNKSLAELRLALDAGVGTIIVDNYHELEMLMTELTAREQKQNILLRITPGIEAHTHEYIQTGQTDSKFGFDVDSGQAQAAYQAASRHPYINVLGIHAHIGSQIFEVNGFVALATRLVEITQSWSFVPQVINTGGGFGIRYTDEDSPRPMSEMLSAIIETIKTTTAELDMPMPQIWIEPGRAIVGEAGITLYEVGARKDIEGLRSYLSVNGGMGDNIRPALYAAKYEAILAKQPLAPLQQTVRIAGKYCESGDILVASQVLPETHSGDIIAMLATGAYGYSMASNYNRQPIPAVVFVENGRAQLVVERQDAADLLRYDHHYQ
ncbi:diaminopimelate decarboxylase [Weissella diestrammenae]|uniref:Diaminopimelate decarboxylase n=1 Tax=Weissella diestrammenae TaxID=1162633 RepID=A0A7G9T486_9LACO|nr:diaminopimelate decarboxylase [Weissella diestrammenae]MCM0583438.1 diaminopimelate decarboxylase [Weissella diestrammenae]QNN74911.1 diaminopimelate decarboxylase [Weissella diestrammenae]